MKSTGVVSKIDDLGRIVLPIELRKTLNIAERDSLEIYVDQSNIILKKYEPGCIFCGSVDGLSLYKDKCVCNKCKAELAK